MGQQSRIQFIKETPRIGWVFLDIDGNLPMVAWECYRGIILPSICYVDIPPLSLWFATMLQNLSSIEVQNEFRLEAIRVKFFPRKVSRLIGFFHFSEKTIAEKFAKVQGNNSNHFQSQLLIEVGFDPLAPYSTYDSEWITYYRGKNSIDEAWMMEYWSGNPCPLATDGPIWESITYTPGLVYGTDIKTRAYQRIAEEFPNSLGMLELSRLAATGGFLAGHCAPYIFLNSQKRPQVGFLLREAEFRSPEFLEYLKKPNVAKNTQDLNIRSSLSTPDFRPYYFKIDAHANDLKGHYIEKPLT